MKQYEMVREIGNQCANNQMRDVFFEEVETDAPGAYGRRLPTGREVERTADYPAPDRVTVVANTSGITQKFLFTEI